MKSLQQCDFKKKYFWINGVSLRKPVREVNTLALMNRVKVKVKSLSHVWFFATSWTVARQTPLSMGLSRQSSQPRDQTQVSHIAGRHFNLWATREAQFKLGENMDIWLLTKIKGRGESN